MIPAARIDVLIPSTRGPEAADRAIASARAAAPDLDLVFHVIEDPSRRGAAWARNEAARRGHAPLIALLDDDDLWLPGRLAEAPGLLDDPAVAIVCGDAERATGGRFLAPTSGGRRRPVRPGVHGHAALVADCFVCASTVTVRRADWERAGGMPEDLVTAEDYALWLRLTGGGRRVRVVDAVIARIELPPRDRALDADRERSLTNTREALRREARVPVPRLRFGWRRALRDLSRRDRI